MQNNKGEMTSPWKIPLLIDTVPRTEDPAWRTVLHAVIDF